MVKLGVSGLINNYLEADRNRLNISELNQNRKNLQRDQQITNNEQRQINVSILLFLISSTTLDALSASPHPTYPSKSDFKSHAAR
jgi:hypothetical protein